MTSGLWTLNCYSETIFFCIMEEKNQVVILMSLGNKALDLREKIHHDKI